MKKKGMSQSMKADGNPAMMTSERKEEVEERDLLGHLPTRRRRSGVGAREVGRGCRDLRRERVEGRTRKGYVENEGIVGTSLEEEGLTLPLRSQLCLYLLELCETKIQISSKVPTSLWL